jgi:hypothetical protein
MHLEYVCSKIWRFLSENLEDGMLKLVLILLRIMDVHNSYFDSIVAFFAFRTIRAFTAAMSIIP